MWNTYTLWYLLLLLDIMEHYLLPVQVMLIKRAQADILLECVLLIQCGSNLSP